MSFTTQLPSAQEYVYVIHAKGTNRIKLGFSKTPQRRLAELQTAAPYQLQMLACWPGSRNRETRLHRYMAQFRKIGEWFEVPPFIGLKIYEIVMQQPITAKMQRMRKTVQSPAKTIRPKCPPYHYLQRSNNGLNLMQREGGKPKYRGYIGAAQVRHLLSLSKKEQQAELLRMAEAYQPKSTRPERKPAA